MKKLLILASVITLSVTMASAATTQQYKTNVQTTKYTEKTMVSKDKSSIKPAPPRKMDFEQRLNLDENQLKKAKELRLKSREKMKPLMKQLHEKHLELAKIQQEDILESQKQIKINKVTNDIHKIEKKINTLRIKNMKDFENILTEDQKKELIKMKAEGRKDFAKNHPPKMPPNGPGHNFGPRPDFPTDKK